MSTIIDSMVNNPGPEVPVPVPVNIATGLTEVIFANCECCGLKEECTPSYFDTIRERYGGKWICGLCSEAVKDEMLRCQKLISPDEAMDRHFSFCSKFRASGPPQDPTVHLIRAMSQVLRKSLLSPKSVRSMPCSPTSSKRGRNFSIKGTVLTRSESCFPSLTLVDMEEACE